jgi:regulator of sirC expression with transglutaminase-like and TPR domain
MAIIYAYIAQRLDLPIYGVNLPKNFVLAYKDEISSFSTYSETDPNNILFYLNPFNKGAVFGRREIDYFIKQQNLEHEDKYFIPCTNKEMIKELIQNLLIAYEKLGYPDKIYDLNILLEILN